MRTHNITTQARVGGKGRMKRTIAPRGVLALSLGVALLAATASTASADRLTAASAARDVQVFPWHCPGQLAFDCELAFTEQFSEPGQGRTFDFGNRQVRTTSPAQRFALLVYDGPFDPSISVSGDYAQTNDCPPSPQPPPSNTALKGCLITVTFTPTGTGPKHGTLSTGPGGPTQALTGTGVTTPTPPALPLRLLGGKGSTSGIPAVYDLSRKTRKLKIAAATTNDSTVEASGDVKKTTKRLKGDDLTVIRGKLKRWERLNVAKYHVDGRPGSPYLTDERKPGNPTIEIKLKATDDFDQTATQKLKVWLTRNCC